MSGDLMTIREMCDAFDVTPRTLRFYEAKELLAPIRQGQKRLFTKRERARLKLILRGKRFGFALEEIRQLLNLYEPGDPDNIQLRRTRELATERLAQMIRERDELDTAISELRGHIDCAGRLLAQRQTCAAAE
ncbi:MerR family transcriptional regulator [Roseovarius dicentrarchi]|uniref:MerR family transcriptional regulator n=1 Tax=Roseovarius dicentrarchi TaxID=2250573 RepID=UPI000DE913E1|nr:MerR family DNA-binding transcriptional regulator [Roseovarius dicentrarchi]